MGEYSARKGKMILVPCSVPGSVRNCRGKSRGIAHEPLTQLVAADVWGTNKDDGTLPVGPRVVQGHLLVNYRVLA